MHQQPRDEVPAADVLAGMSIMPVPDGWTPLEAVVMLKCLNEDGEPRWVMRATGGLNSEELLGALVVRTDMLRQDILASFEDD